MLSPEHVRRYLNRIAFFGSPEPTAETLREIQWAHLQAVPFEALDICPLGRSFSIDPQAVYQKVVVQRRGGYCFELNGLAAALLEAMGYQVTLLAAHFPDNPDASADPFDHLVLEVTVPGDSRRWYFDVAAGRQNPDQPVPIDGETEDGRYRTRTDGNLRLFEQREQLEWRSHIAWTLIPRRIEDFEARSRFFQNNPESPFKRGPLCTVMIPDGRQTLSKWTMITTIRDERSEVELTTLNGVRSTLAEWFGIDIDFNTWWDGDA